MILDCFVLIILVWMNKDKKAATNWINYRYERFHNTKQFDKSGSIPSNVLVLITRIELFIHYSDRFGEFDFLALGFVEDFEDVNPLVYVKWK